MGWQKNGCGVNHWFAPKFGYRFLIWTAMTICSSQFVFGAESRPEVEQAIRVMGQATSGKGKIVRSSMTGFVSFLSVPGGASLRLPVSETAPAEARALAVIQEFGPAFGLRNTDAVRVTRSSQPDGVGMEHVRLQQVYRGIPITGAELTIHLAGNRLISVLAKTVPEPSLSIEPQITAQEAEDRVRQRLAKHLDRSGATLTTRLEILSRSLLDGVEMPPHLVWFVEARGFDLWRYFWVDARRGRLLLDFNQLPNAKNRETYTSGATNTLPGTLLRSEGTPAIGDVDVDNAHDGAGEIYDFYMNKFGRDSYDNAGSTIISSAHYCDQCPSPMANAFWNGTQMVYGEGLPAADDVVGHEYTHAIINLTSNLFYYMQSGALNESYADVIGETLDLQNGRGNDAFNVRWVMGEDWGAPTGDNTGIRNMMNPNAFNDPAKMSDSTNFKCYDSRGVDAGGVHGNSGIPNHAYALMVDGGSYNGFTITGIGLDKAVQIQFRAVSIYLVSASGFLDNYNAVQQSCTDLVGQFGISSGDCTEVKKALDAVEMGAAWPCSPAQAAVPDRCSAGLTPSNTFFDDFENSTSGNWGTNDLIGGVGSVWLQGNPATMYSSEFATSPTQHLFGWNANVTSDSTAEMANDVTIPANAFLQFNHAFGFENGTGVFYDGGVMEYSTNGGTNWSDVGSLISAGANYGGSISTCCSNPLAGRSAFVNESWGYTATQLNLSSLSGQAVRFRFRMGTDGAVDDYGWAVDDFGIYTCVATSPTPTKTPTASPTKTPAPGTPTPSPTTGGSNPTATNTPPVPTSTPLACDCPDADFDGVPNAWDLCPNTSVGSYVDSSGCAGSTLGSAPSQQRWNLILLLGLLGVATLLRRGHLMLGKRGR